MSDSRLKIHHGPDSGEATTFPHIVFSTTPNIRMAFYPGTPKEESRNCLGLDSRHFAESYLFAQTSDWDEVLSKLVALVEGFPMACYTPLARLGVGSIPDFWWSGIKLAI
jgi:hypothetical protein